MYLILINFMMKKFTERRKLIFDGLNDALPDDYIMYSDSDEIPNPKKLENFILKNKYGILLFLS
mgnify:CR=1 FL=1